MNRRRVVFAGLVFTPLAIIAACTFPEVTFGPDNADGSSPDALSPTHDGALAETSTTDTGSSGSSGNPGTDSGSNDAGEADVVINTADATTLDANGCAIQPLCDCDNDGYKAADCGADATLVDANLLPGDCDDLNAARHPDAGFTATGTDNGDWNCDNQVERFPPVNSINCPSSGTGLNLTCAKVTDFYISAPDCGAPGDLYQCTGMLNVGSCGTATSEGKTATENCE